MAREHYDLCQADTMAAPRWPPAPPTNPTRIRELSNLYHSVSSQHQPWRYLANDERVHMGLTYRFMGPTLITNANGYLCAAEIVFGYRSGIAIIGN